MVGVDAKTFRSRADGGLGERWPFARRRFAQVIDRLVADGAKVIAYDIQFTEPSASQKDDELLVESVAAAGEAGSSVVLATSEVAEDGSTKVFGGDDVVRELGARVGNALIPGGKGSVVRELPYSSDGLTSFAVVAAEEYLGHRVTRREFDAARHYIDFPGPPGTVQLISFADVLFGTFKKGTFTGRTVVVGAVAPSLQDNQPTSTSGSEVMPGPEIQASAMHTIIEDFPVRRTPGWLAVVLTIFFLLLPPLLAVPKFPGLGRRLPVFVAFALSVLVGAGYFGLAVLLFNAGTVLALAAPLIALLVSAIFTLVVVVLLEASDKRRIHALFARFVPEDVVDQVVANADEELRLGGEERVVTVMFSDLRGFTTYSESREPGEVIDILNGYLSEMTDAILDAGGTLITYMGDGIMAVFGAPLDQPDHADRAVRAARDMLVRLADFNRTRVPADQEPFRMGIGLNTGPVISGNVGSERRLEYTTIGDTVNTSSRIEGLTKGSPFQILLADSTVEALAVRPQDLAFHEDVPIRGRSETVRLWGIAGTPSADGA
ncbi:unannotated protein [freshwater metagenome]|uniref:Unannotated protein n=1 Tax=freshwater metagenome TaxID=449393 RepID=A0A6J7H9Y2_9ZZZZ|nr:CHASE2 domain-containing protein [Actinomycetota bacterium]